MIDSKLPETGFIRLPEVLRFFPVSRSTWWAGINKGRFPKGIKLSPRVTAWNVEEIRGLIQSYSIGVVIEEVINEKK